MARSAPPLFNSRIATAWIVQVQLHCTCWVIPLECYAWSPTPSACLRGNHDVTSVVNPILVASRWQNHVWIISFHTWISDKQGCSAKKEVWERTYQTTQFQQQFKIIFKLVFNEVFTFITLQTKTWERCGNAFPPHSTAVTSMNVTYMALQIFSEFYSVNLQILHKLMQAIPLTTSFVYFLHFSNVFFLSRCTF